MLFATEGNEQNRSLRRHATEFDRACGGNHHRAEARGEFLAGPLAKRTGKRDRSQRGPAGIQHGGGNSYQTLVTITGVLLTESDTDNYVV